MSKDRRITICSRCASESHCGIREDDLDFRVDDSVPCKAYDCSKTMREIHDERYGEGDWDALFEEDE